MTFSFRVRSPALLHIEKHLGARWVPSSHADLREPARGPQRSLPVAFRAISQTMAVQDLELFSNLITMRNRSTKGRNVKP